jgi:hypothetical protein
VCLKLNKRKEKKRKRKEKEKGRGKRYQEKRYQFISTFGKYLDSAVDVQR